MATPGIGQLLIERYAKTRRERLFRPNGADNVLLQDSARGHFPVYLSPHGSSPDLVGLRAVWSARCLHTKRHRLHDCVNHFNDRNKLLTASVHETHDSRALEVVGKSQFWVRDEEDFRPFVRFVDMSLASAVNLFERVYDEMELPSAAQLDPWLQNAG